MTFGDAIAESTLREITAVVARLDQKRLPWIVDLVPAFTSLAVHYDPRLVQRPADRTPYEAVLESLRSIAHNTRAANAEPRAPVEVPVCYGGDFGPDLGEVAAKHQMSVDDVVTLHTGAEYLVYMVGFMPGFAYLGGLDERIATPRRSSPRTAVPAGTVGIGGQQTGVYPLVSPGGWNLIGRTPLHMFDPAREPPTMLATGDRVRFRAISLDEFAAIEAGA